MTFLHRLWLALRGKPLPNPKEQQLRTHARRMAAVAHRVAATPRGDSVRESYRQADERLRR